MTVLIDGAAGQQLAYREGLPILDLQTLLLFGHRHGLTDLDSKAKVRKAYEDLRPHGASLPPWQGYALRGQPYAPGPGRGLPTCALSAAATGRWAPLTVKVRWGSSSVPCRLSSCDDARSAGASALYPSVKTLRGASGKDMRSAAGEPEASHLWPGVTGGATLPPRERRSPQGGRPHEHEQGNH